jgi:hypothetical protein
VAAAAAVAMVAAAAAAVVVEVAVVVGDDDISVEFGFWKGRGQTTHVLCLVCYTHMQN